MVYQQALMAQQLETVQQEASARVILTAVMDIQPRCTQTRLMMVTRTE